MVLSELFTGFFEGIVNIIKYIYSIVGSNLILFGIFIYLITISFFLKTIG